MIPDNSLPGVADRRSFSSLIEPITEVRVTLSLAGSGGALFFLGLGIATYVSFRRLRHQWITKEDVVRLGSTFIDELLFPAPCWLLNAEVIDKKTADHSLRLAE